METKNIGSEYRYTLDLSKMEKNLEEYRKVKDNLSGKSLIYFEIINVNALCEWVLRVISFVRLKFPDCKVLVYLCNTKLNGFEDYREICFILRSLGVSFIGEKNPINRGMSLLFMDEVKLKKIDHYGLDCIYVFSERSIMENYREDGMLNTCFYRGHCMSSEDFSMWNISISLCEKVIWVERGDTNSEKERENVMKICNRVGIDFVIERL